ncbi:MAG TPA: undecaprenyl-diphosphate phosphatase [Candidatus Izemoplasmatales bacterium]|nr:undecaprenyl-diphosphate phosphatase [Candidatus Izemoplasmatales bacterium]
MGFSEIIQHFLEYIILGIVQGITEVLPISSSGHVTIAQQLMGINTDEGILFLILVNIGSLVAILFHFRKFLARLIKNFLSYLFRPSTRQETKEDWLYGWKVVLASLPIGIVGFFFNHSINLILADYPLVLVGLGLLITGTALYLVRNKSYVNGRQTITFRDAAVIGLGQMFAPIPGLSRSGITTSSGLMRKLSMETVLIFSFMLYIPVSVGSMLKYGIDYLQSPATFSWGFDVNNGWFYAYYVVAAAFSFFATLFSIKYIFIWFRRGKLVLFSIYTLVLGTISLFVGLFLM